MHLVTLHQWEWIWSLSHALPITVWKVITHAQWLPPGRLGTVITFLWAEREHTAVNMSCVSNMRRDYWWEEPLYVSFLLWKALSFFYLLFFVLVFFVSTGSVYRGAVATQAADRLLLLGGDRSETPPTPLLASISWGYDASLLLL